LTFTIRRATPPDLDALFRLWQERADYYLRFESRLPKSDQSGTVWREAMAGCLGRDDARVLVADRAGELIGYMVGWVWNQPPFFEQLGMISEMSVDGHCKQGGVGSALLADLQTWFKERSVIAVEIRVPQQHPIEQAFWRAVGAQPFIDHLYLKME